MPSDMPGWFAPLVADLKAARGRSFIHAGPTQPASVHALVHAMNEALGGRGQTYDLIAPVEADPVDHAASLRGLIDDMNAGRVTTLLIIDSNPVFTAPGFADALAHVPLSMTLADGPTETGAKTTWNLPARHGFEDWSDARAYDGTVTLLQPQARPLYDGISPHYLLALFAAPDEVDSRDVVRQTHGLNDQQWHDALATGLVAGTQAAPIDVALKPVQPRCRCRRRRAGHHAAGPPRSAYPRWPLRQQCLAAGTAAAADEADLGQSAAGFARHRRAAEAGERGSGDGGERRCAGDAAGLDHARPGGGLCRRAAGLRPQRRGDGGPRGRLRRLSSDRRQAVRSRCTRPMATTCWRPPNITTRSSPTPASMCVTAPWPRSRLIRASSASRAPKPQEYNRQPAGPAAWGMSIDLNACIGCNACVVACMAENNIPVVGKQQVIHEREMHWLRIDRYYEGSPEAPDMLFQPVLCQHCERAPCEIVCPVGATVHDEEGLNVMVYNRCVGTRFCSNNCPYKVRRFNYFAFAAEERRPAVARNPEVTVRARGVMEKCTFCLQRIAAARIDADADNRPVGADEVQTACQAACPTQAFTFGNMAEGGQVVERKKSPLTYALLDDQDTQPRVTYEARIRNAGSGTGA